MKLHSFLYIIGFLFLLIGCNTNDQLKYDDQAEFEYEIQVLNEIFVDLTKEMWIHYGYPKHPPPPPPITDNNGKIIGYDSTLYLQRIEIYTEDTANFSVEQNSVLLAFSDTLYQIKDDDIPIHTQFPSYKYKSVFNYSSTFSKPNKKIVLDSLTNTGYFNLKYSSEFKGKGDLDQFYFELYKKDVKGLLACSRIHFDKNKKFGIFTCGYYLASLNAHGGCIYIRKINGRWRIEKFVSTWIS